MSADPWEEEAVRDMTIRTQPVLWAQAMLEEADRARMPDARDAILSRVGASLLGQFGVTIDLRELRATTRRWEIS